MASDNDQIKYSELIKDDTQGFSQLIEALKSVSSQMETLKKDARELSAELKGMVSTTKGGRDGISGIAASAEELGSKKRNVDATKESVEAVAGSIIKMKQQLKELTDRWNAMSESERINDQTNGTVSESIKILNQRLSQNNKQLKGLTVEWGNEEQAIARLNAVAKQNNRIMELQSKVTASEQGSLNQMRAKYNLLIASIGQHRNATEADKASITKMVNEAKKLNIEISKLETSYGQHGRNVGNYTDSINKADVATRSFGLRVQEAFKRFVAFNMAFLSFRGAINFTKALINTRKEMEGYIVTFKAFAGEVGGSKMFENVKQLAYSTPLTLQSVSKAAQTMMGFGVATEKVMPMLKRLGDISQADNERFQNLALAYSQVTQAGRLMGQDCLQLINAGFNPLFYISKKTGKSMRELKDEMSKGQISIEMVNQAIIDATSEGGIFNDMLDKQSKTMRGSLNYLQGAWIDMLNEIGESSQGFFVSVIKLFTKLIQNYKDTLYWITTLSATYGIYRIAIALTTKAQEAHNLATKSGIALEKAYQTLMKKNIWGLVAAGIAIAIAAIIKWIEKVRESKSGLAQLNEVTSHFNENVSKESKNADYLFSILKKAKQGTDEYKRAKEAIINQYGRYLPGLEKELNSVNNLQTAYDMVSVAIRNMERQKERQTYLSSYISDFNKAQSGLQKSLNDFETKNSNSIKNGGAERQIIGIVNKVLSGTHLTNAEQLYLANGEVASGFSGIRKLNKSIFNYYTAKTSLSRATSLINNKVGKDETYTPGTDVNSTDVDTSAQSKAEKLAERLKTQREKVANLLEDANTHVQEAIEGSVRQESKGNPYEDAYNKSIKESETRLKKITDDIERLKKEVNNKLTNKNDKKSIRAEVEYLQGQRDALASSAEKLAKDAGDAALKAYEDEQDAKEKEQKEAAAQRMIDEYDAQVEINQQQMELEHKSENEKTRYALEAERERIKLLLSNEESGMTELSDAEIKKYKARLGVINNLIGTGSYKKTKQYNSLMDVLSYDNDGKRSGWTNAFGSGMDDSEWDTWSSNVVSAFDKAKDALTSWMDARKTAAEEAVTEANTAVSAAESALDREMEARNAGYANDVTLRRKELEDAKKSQEKALEEQRKIAKQQVLIDAATQSSSLVTATANIWASHSKLGPAGIAASIAAIAVMWGSFIASKVKSYNLAGSTQKFSEGGVERLEGGSHQSGNDVDLGVNSQGQRRRAEGGEYFAVINKRNSRKYGLEIPNIINALNAGMFQERYIPVGNAKIEPKITVSGTGANLSRVESDLSALRRNTERSVSTEGEWVVERYKNLTRRVKK